MTYRVVVAKKIRGAVRVLSGNARVGDTSDIVARVSDAGPAVVVL